MRLIDAIMIVCIVGIIATLVAKALRDDPAPPPIPVVPGSLRVVGNFRKTDLWDLVAVDDSTRHTTCYVIQQAVSCVPWEPREDHGR